MKLIDLSQPLYHEAPHCPVHRPVEFRRTADHPADGWRMEEIAMATHTGSHLDAPLHRIAGGKSITDFPLESFAGPAYLADLRSSGPDARLDADCLQRALGHVPPDAIALLATGWGQRRAQTDEWEKHSPHVVPSGARWLVEHRIRGVGIDHFSIGGMGPENDETHTIILGAGLWVLEDLSFPPEVFALPQPLRFWALPMNWPGCSGAFCRPVVEH